MLFRTGWKLASAAVCNTYAAKFISLDGGTPNLCSQPNLLGDVSLKLNSVVHTLLRFPTPVLCGECDLCLQEPCSCPQAVKSYRGLCEWKFEFDVTGDGGVMQKEQRDGNWLRFKKTTKVSLTGKSEETIYLGCAICKNHHTGMLATANKCFCSFANIIVCDQALYIGSRHHGSMPIRL